MIELTGQRVLLRPFRPDEHDPSRDGGIDSAVYAMTNDDWHEVKDTWIPTS